MLSNALTLCTACTSGAAPGAKITQVSLAATAFGPLAAASAPSVRDFFDRAPKRQRTNGTSSTSSAVQAPVQDSCVLSDDAATEAWLAGGADGSDEEECLGTPSVTPHSRRGGPKEAGMCNHSNRAASCATGTRLLSEPHMCTEAHALDRSSLAHEPYRDDVSGVMQSTSDTGRPAPTSGISDLLCLPSPSASQLSSVRVRMQPQSQNLMALTGKGPNRFASSRNKQMKISSMFKAK